MRGVGWGEDERMMRPIILRYQRIAIGTFLKIILCLLNERIPIPLIYINNKCDCVNVNTTVHGDSRCCYQLVILAN